MKKIITLLMTAFMCLSAAACGGSSTTSTSTSSTGSETSSTTSSSTTTAAEPSTSSKDMVTLTFELSTLFIVPNNDAVQVVEDELNRYLREDLNENYQIDLVITSISDYLTTVPMKLAGGEGAPDIIQVFTLADMVGQGYIQSLDQYKDNELKPTLDLIGNIVGSGKVGGELYMVPRYFGTVLDWKWIYNKEYVEGAGVDVSKVTDLGTLGEACAELKAVYPNDSFIVYTNQFNVLYNNYTHTSIIGTYGATVGDDPTIVNYYETEAYKSAIYKAYEFRQKGYADPEGSSNTQSHDAVVMSGSSKGVIMGHSADCEGIASMFTNTNTYGAEFGAVTIGISDLSTDTLGVGISYTCKNPSEAARFINLLYTDEYVWDTIIYGKEGQDWEWNADHTLYTYPEGLDFNSIPYNVQYSCGMIGNGFYTRSFEGATDSGSNPDYGKELMAAAWCPPLYGFIPSSVNVMNEAAAIANVVEQYADVLQYGDVNPDDVYPKFLQALKDAGIDKLIEEYNAQAADFQK